MIKYTGIYFLYCLCPTRAHTPTNNASYYIRITLIRIHGAASEEQCPRPDVTRDTRRPWRWASQAGILISKDVISHAHTVHIFIYAYAYYIRIYIYGYIWLYI